MSYREMGLSCTPGSGVMTQPQHTATHFILKYTIHYCTLRNTVHYTLQHTSHCGTHHTTAHCTLHNTAHYTLQHTTRYNTLHSVPHYTSKLTTHPVHLVSAILQFYPLCIPIKRGCGVPVFLFIA